MPTPDIRRALAEPAGAVGSPHAASRHRPRQGRGHLRRRGWCAAAAPARHASQRRHRAAPRARHSVARARDAPSAGRGRLGAEKGQTYGTILVDLEVRRVVDLLPDRTAETLAEWLE